MAEMGVGEKESPICWAEKVSYTMYRERERETAKTKVYTAVRAGVDELNR